MTPENFAYWLTGFFEIRESSPAKDEPLTKEQVQVIRDHLDLVFTKVTPDRGYNPTKMVETLNPKVDPMTGGKNVVSDEIIDAIAKGRTVSLNDFLEKKENTYCGSPSAWSSHMNPASPEEVAAAFLKAGITVCPYESGNIPRRIECNLGSTNDAIYAPYDGGVLKYTDGTPVYKLRKPDSHVLHTC